MDTPTYTEIGVIQRRQGLNGNLVVKLNHDIPDLGNLGSLYVRINHTLVPYGIERFFWQHRKAILKLEGVDDPQTAHHLQSRLILVPPDILPLLSPQEIHLDSILGYHVVDVQEGGLGTVQAIYAPSQQKLLAISYRGQELLVPYHEDIVTHIDHAQQTVTVHLPNGFIKAMC